MKLRQCYFKAFVGRGSGNKRQAIVRATCGSPYTAFVRRHYKALSLLSGPDGSAVTCLARDPFGKPDWALTNI